MIIKICGIKNQDTLSFCEKNNVNYFGMIFYKNSPRNISFESAKELQNISKKFKINGVGVFVNESVNNLKQYINYLGLKFIQLHGEEDNNYIKEIKKLNLKIIKKISINDEKDIDNIDNFNDADFFLFDYKPKKGELPGGNAKSFNWNIIKNIKINKPWFVSGGINLDNIHFLKTNIKPFGIDLSSGVEKELGIKDNQIINNFIDKVKNA